MKSLLGIETTQWSKRQYADDPGSKIMKSLLGIETLDRCYGSHY